MRHCARAVVALAFLFGCLACNEEEQDTEIVIAPSVRCRVNDDCPQGTSCQVSNGTSATIRLGIAEPTAALALPAGCNDPCFEQWECPVGMACLNTQPPSMPQCKGCIPGCKHEDCEPGSACEGDACQPVMPCSSPDFAGCPEFWICDPASLDASVSLYAYSNLDDEAYDTTLRAVAAGCRQLLCDEPDSKPCPEYSRCDENLRQCRSIPCTELMMCPYNPDGICRLPHVDESADSSGCVFRTCEEGFACAVGEVCDIANTHPSTRGCRPQRCDEGYSCLTSQTCEPTLVGRDVHGCTSSQTTGSSSEVGICR